jgi:antibiotic biosynthesis monooxygenase (ABM) superfamily enzyme
VPPDAAADAPVTVVVQTRTKHGEHEAFAKWQAGYAEKSVTV